MGRGSARVALVLSALSAAALAGLGACFSSSGGPPGAGLDGGDDVAFPGDDAVTPDAPASHMDATLGDDAPATRGDATTGGDAPTTTEGGPAGDASDATAATGDGGDAARPTYVATQIAMSDQGNCALITDGTVRCWGAFSGVGFTRDSGLSPTSFATPIAVQGLPTIKQIAGWGNYLCALSTAGTDVYCWGNALTGGVPVPPPADGGATPYEYLPTQVPLPSAASSIRLGIDGACALLLTGQVDCWGHNPSAVYGISPVPSGSYFDPTPMTGVSGPTDLQMAANATCLLFDSGTASCVGYGPAQLGSPSAPGTVSTLGAAVPVALGGPAASLPLAAGANACAILADGTVQCWGSSEYSTDAGNRVSVTTPQTVAGLSNVKALSAGYFHACAVDGAGDVYCWGSNTAGANGDPDASSFYSVEYPPIRVPGLPAPAIGVAVSTDLLTSGVSTSCALLQGGSVYCWGSNNGDALGRGSPPMGGGAYPVPAPVAF